MKFQSYQDNKKNNIRRGKLSEEFHKVILNNIIIGKDFTEKAQAKIVEMQNLHNTENQENEELKLNIKRECFLYISESLYYFMIAEKQISDKKIIEIGKRDKYIKYLNNIGILTLVESLSVYENSIKELRKISQKLLNMDFLDMYQIKLDEIEIKTLSYNIKKLDRIIENILEWKNNLDNTIKNIYT